MTMIYLILRLSLMPQSHVQPHRAAPERPSVLVLDLSGPAEPESEFPTIAAKGRL